MYRRTGRGRLLLLAFLALALVVITLDYRTGGDGPLENAKDISTTIVAPIQRGITAVFRPVGNFFSSIGDLSELRSENEELRAERDDLQGDIFEADSIKDENQELRGELKLQESWTTMDPVAASVIANSAANYRWSVRIDKGADDGIKTDMSVIATDGLVGKIIDVDDTTSEVILLIDPQASAGAKVKEEGLIGAIRGNGADEPLTLIDIDPEANVQDGDEIVTSGYDLGIFPPGIPIGEVVSASGEAAQLEQKIEVEPFVDFESLEFVQVLLETGPLLDDDNQKDKNKEERR